MSKRRKAGDKVWLAPNSGFVGESNRLQATIQDEEPTPCCFLCEDPLCQEWPTLFAEEDGKTFVLFHVNECQMFDEPQEAQP